LSRPELSDPSMALNSGWTHSQPALSSTPSAQLLATHSPCTVQQLLRSVIWLSFVGRTASI